MYRITHFAFVLVAAVAFTQGLGVAAEPLQAEAEATETAAVATPNHASPRLDFMRNVATLRAEPEPAEPSAAAAFAAADTMLYAKANARLRAAPSTAAGIVTKFAANAPLHAIARSADGAWWQVTFADTFTGYVHRDAVTRNRLAQTKPRPATTPVAATPPVATASEPPRSMLARHGESLLGYVDQAVDWVSDVAAHGKAPKVIRAER